MSDVSDLKKGERCIQFPREVPVIDDDEIDWDALPALRPRAGSYCVMMDPPPEQIGGVWLPNLGDGFRTRMGPAGTLRSDSATVIASGRDVPLVPGDRVVVAPYSGHRWLRCEGIDGFAVFGCSDDDWGDLTPMVYRNGKWELLLNWLAIEMEVHESVILTEKPQWLYTGSIVMAGPDATIPVGQRVVVNRDIAQVRPDDARWFHSEGGPLSKRTVLVREVDSFGEARIEALIEGEVG